ncbi:alpha-ketoglutarate-dependent dioxygenase AlkB [Rhodobacteraceae bacterium NNCM2]|nr:alpha-ketoglutarate-dependent dioxygenase AlkB [Coraliihabitans acroporae]
MSDEIEIAGFRIRRGLVGPGEQAAMVADCREIIRAAPLVRPVTGWGKPMSVRMTSAGRVGWVIDRGRYRYAARHPESGQPWPPIPASILAIWQAVSDWPAPPDCCLLNWYDAAARMGLHQDKDEGAFDAPVVSISLGDPARFRMGGTERGGKTQSTVLDSGDVVVMAGPARLAFHGIDRLLTDGPPHPLTGRGRINLTLRVVDRQIMG